MVIAVTVLAACASGSMVSGPEASTADPTLPVLEQPSGEARPRILFHSCRPLDPREDWPCDYRIFTMRPDGTQVRKISDEPGRDPRWSPDGSRIAFICDARGRQICIMKADGSGLRQLTTSGSFKSSPSWSPNGKRLAFLATREGQRHISQSAIFVVSRGRNSSAHRITRWDEVGGSSNPVWSPEGPVIAYSVADAHDYEIWTKRADATGATRLTFNNQDDLHPDWSTDGDRLAVSYGTLECCRGHRHRIYVMDADGSDHRQVGFNRTSSHPSWAPNGRWIVFQAGPNPTEERLFKVRVADGEVVRLTRRYFDSHPDWGLTRFP